MFRFSARIAPLVLASFTSILSAACGSAQGASAAQSQVAPATLARTTVDAKFVQYLTSPHGEIVGLVLDGGTIVRVPPRAFAPSAPTLAKGDAVHVEGETIPTPGARSIGRAIVRRGTEAVADATALSHDGHEGHRRGGREHGVKEGEKAAQSLAPLSTSGAVVAIADDRKGRPELLVLDDGTTVGLGHFGAHGGATGIAVKVGDRVSVRGKGGTYPSGKAMRAEAITLPGGTEQLLAKRLELAPVSRDATIATVLVSPRGRVEGIVLADDTIVRFRAAGDEATTLASLKEGSAIHLEGRGAERFVFAEKLSVGGAAIELAAKPEHLGKEHGKGEHGKGEHGRRHGGEKGAHAALAELDVNGVVAKLILGHDGDVQTIVFADGAQVHLTPRMSEDLGDALKVGATIKVHGEGGKYARGVSIRAARLELAEGRVFEDAGRHHGEHRPPAAAPSMAH